MIALEKMQGKGEPLFYIDPALIRPNPHQPRRHFGEGALAGLAESITRYGILQPLTIREVREGGSRYFELVAGERRLRAAVLAGQSRVPCRMLRVDDAESAELAVVENLQREDLNMFEEALALSELLTQYGMTQDCLASRLAVSQSYVANKLRLLKLEQTHQRIILDSGLSERHARAILRLPNELREGAITHIAKEGLNVADTERYVDALLIKSATPTPRKRTVRGAIKDLRLFYNSLDHALGIMRQSGMDTRCEKRETADGVELTIRIRRKEKAEA
jgi:ParB family chromosome partitioning protein